LHSLIENFSFREIAWVSAQVTQAETATSTNATTAELAPSTNATSTNATTAELAPSTNATSTNATTQQFGGLGSNQFTSAPGLDIDESMR